MVISRYAHPNLNLSTQRQHSRPLPLDRHPTWLCLDVVKILIFNGLVQYLIWPVGGEIFIQIIKFFGRMASTIPYQRNMRYNTTFRMISHPYWSLAKKAMQGNENCSAPKTVIGVTANANEKYLPYLQFCGKAFFLWSSCIVGVKVAQS